MSNVREELDQELTRLREGVRDRLTKEDDGFIAELIDNREFALALEVLVDAFAEEKLTLTPAEVEAIEALAKKMGMSQEILDRTRAG